MNKSKLTVIQFSCLICFPILSLFSGIGTYNITKIAQVDSYLSVIISYLLGMLPFLLFIFIFNYKPELNITEKINFLFGKYLGTIINIIINFLILCIGIILIYNISNFAISQFLDETPLLVFMIFLGLILVYNVSLGIENITRVSIVFLGIICFLTLISTFGILPHFESSNIKPFLEYGIQKPLTGGFTLTLTNVIPTFMLLIIEKNKVTDNQKSIIYLFFFYSLAFLFIFIATFLTIGSLGIYLSNLYQYPEYTVLKKISLFNFIDRIENFIYIKWILNSVICLSLVIYYITHSIKKTSKKILPTIITGIIIFLSLKIFKNTNIFYQFSFSVFPYVCLLLLFIFIIIGINIFVRNLAKN